MIPGATPAFRRAAWGIVLAALIGYAARQLQPQLLGLPASLPAALRALTVDAGARPLGQSLADAAVTAGALGAILGIRLLVGGLARRSALWARLLADGGGTLAVPILASAGLGMLLVLMFLRVAPAVPSPAPAAAMIVALVGLGVVVWRAEAAAPRPPDGPPGASPPGAPPPATSSSAPGQLGALLRPRSRPVGFAATWIAVVVLVLLATRLVEDAASVVFYRGPATGDEAYFWWRASMELHRLGLAGYVGGFDVASYPPGYPLLANLALGWLPDQPWEAALRAVPFLLGIAVLELFFRSPANDAAPATPSAPSGDPAPAADRAAAPARLPTLAVIALVSMTVLDKLPWVRQLLFEAWYGEAMAIAVLAALLVVLDRARSGRASAAIALLALGLGAFAAISKPPMSMLLLPAILPAWLVAAVLLRRPDQPWRPLALIVAATGVGALAASQLWAGALRDAGIAPYYAVGAGELLDLHPEGSFARLVPYVARDYQPVWVTALLVSALALIADPRRFLPPFLVAGGMVLSVFALYLGPWREVEHESGGRYILHGLIGFMSFALGALTPAIRSTMGQWLRWAEARLGGLRARPDAVGPGVAQ